jgi:hypothetical protein
MKDFPYLVKLYEGRTLLLPCDMEHEWNKIMRKELSK